MQVAQKAAGFLRCTDEKERAGQFFGKVIKGMQKMPFIS